MTMLKQHKAAKITYHKLAEDKKNGYVSGEMTDRTIIPTFIPGGNVKAVDVTGLPEDLVAELETHLKEYTKYYKTAVKTIFSFEDWLSQTQGKVDSDNSIKWRTFKLSGITER